jgi:intracellular sulfur oxidation DsrE/DsrF family protein
MSKGVIFHIDENNKWELLLNNVKNLILSCNDRNHVVEVLANGEAVTPYAEHTASFEQKLIELAKLDVLFVACNNSLVGMEIDKERLLPFIKVVPVGVLEIVQKQSEGYAYIKP